VDSAQAHEAGAPVHLPKLVANPSLRQSTWRHFVTVDIDRHLGGPTFMRLGIQFYNTRDANRTCSCGHLLKFCW
jgi:hypothetical protein